MYRRLLFTVLVLAGLSPADLIWTFSVADARPGAVGGVYGYVYPSKTSPGQTTKHSATLSIGGTDVNGNAKLDFHLDGRDFPGAGFGLMFDNAAPIDLRSLDSVQLWIRADRPRKVRFSLSSSDSMLKRAADTGVSFGRDTTIGTQWALWVVRAEDLAWPKWAADAPSVPREDLLSRVFALQFDVGCDSKDGVCSDDVGRIEVDEVRLFGAGGRWNDPQAGDCSGDTLWIDRFMAGNARQNDLGGWWYAYTDRTSTDSTARGYSRILNATNPDSAETWEGPRTDSGAEMSFDLQRWKVYSGYAAIETQLTSPDIASRPQANSFPGAHSISFNTRFDASFPEALGGMVVHLRKKGRSFENGRDHQIQIPVDTIERRWCIDLASFRQPTWSEWIEEFSPDSLLALSFEVRLPSALDEAKSSFRVSEIALHGEWESGVVGRAGRATGRILRSGDGWVYERASGSASRMPWALYDATGRLIEGGVLEAGRSSFRIPMVGRGIALLAIGGEGSARRAFKLMQP